MKFFGLPKRQDSELDPCSSGVTPVEGLAPEGSQNCLDEI